MADKQKRVTTEIHKAMFEDFLMGMTIREIASKYGFSHTTVGNLSVKHKWTEKKVKSHEALIDTLRVRYINSGNNLIERQFKIACKLLAQLEEDIDNPYTLVGKDGNRSPYKVGAFIDNYMKVVQQMNELTGVLPAKDIYELRLKYEALQIKKMEKGIDEDVADLEDNFLEALNSVVEDIGIGGDDSESN